MGTSEKSNYGQFLPSSQLQTQQELFDFADNAAYLLNTKVSGWLVREEIQNGKVLFPTDSSRASNSAEAVYRQVFRKVVEFGTLPNNTAKSVPHGIDITSQYRFVKIHGTANDAVGLHYKPIPHASPTANENISIDIDSQNITIITEQDLTLFTDVLIFLEYVKQA